MIRNETILKMRKIISVMTISAMLLSIAGASVLKANASIFPIDDNPNYISKDRSLDYTGLGMQFAMNKTVDLTGTGVDVTITDAERNSILESVAKDAEEFVKEHQKNFYISILRDELEAISSTYRRTVITVNPDGTSTPETTDIRTIFGKCRNQDGVWMDADGDQPGNMPILIPKMVQEEDLFFGIVDTIYDKIEEIDNTFLGWDYYEDLAEEIYDTYIGSFDPRTSAKPAWVPDGVTRDDSKDFYNEIDKIIELKTQEMYNNKINTLFVKKLGKQLDVKFSFALEELSATGSENNKFGVDGKEVKRGKLLSGKSQMPFSEVDFAADDHIYDEILNEDMNNILSGEEDNPKNNRDGRDVFTHSLIFDLGQLRSSDDSQYAYSENMERSLEDGWEGWHFLLEVGDSLTTYDVFWPLWSYVQTFNLHLNPAVMYTVDNVRADVITDAVFDDSGKLTSISKSILPVDRELSREIDYFAPVKRSAPEYIDMSEDGRYRFKLVESKIDPVKLPNGAEFKDNNEEKIVDIVISNGKVESVEAYETVADYVKCRDLAKAADNTYDKNMHKKLTNAILNGMPSFTNSVKEDPKKSKVIVKYEDEEENKLTEDEELEGEVGEEYVTEELTFDGYTLKETRGEVKGVYESQHKEVIYVYKKTADTETVKSASKSADTGDRTPIVAFIALLAVCATVIAAIVIKRRNGAGKR